MRAVLPRDVFPTTIETPRLSLRKPSSSEIGLYASQAQEACGHSLLSSEQTRAFAEFMVGHWNRYGFGFLVVNAYDPTGETITIGHIGFKYTDARPGHWAEHFDAIELGYSLIPSARGRGYATEGSRGALAAAFAAFDLSQILAKCNRDNAKSAAVLLRCGMREVASSDDMRRFAIGRPR